MLVFYIFTFFPLLYLTSPKCAFTHTCTKHTQIDFCKIPKNNTQEPQIFTYQEEFQCPEFANKSVCCNNDQNFLLQNYFFLIRSVLGSQGFNEKDGCDVCAANLYRFWCNFFCSPNQVDFVKTGKIIKDKNHKVLNITINFYENTAEEVFKSCAKTAHWLNFISRNNEINNTQGFFYYIIENELVFKQRIYMNYTKDISEKPLNFEVDKCNTKYFEKVNKWGYPIRKDCTCENCHAVCENDNNYVNVENNPIKTEEL